MLIRVDLQGARAAAAEAKVVQQAVGQTAAATQAANTANATGARRANRASKAWTGVGKSAKVGAAGILGAIGLVGLAGKQALETTTDLALTTNTIKKYFRSNSEESSKLGGILQSLGIDAKGASMAFGTLDKQRAAALKDWKTSGDTFKQIGFSKKELQKSGKDFTGFLRDTSDGIDEIGRKGGQLSVMRTLFGRGATSMGPLLRDGRDGFNEMTDAADRFHVTMTDDMLEAQLDYIKAQRESKVATQGLQLMLADELRPEFMKAHEAYQDFVEEITDPSLTRDQRLDIIEDKMEGLGEVIVDVMTEAVEAIGESGPAIAVAFVRGFMESNVWGKLFVGGWIVNKILGAALFGSMVKGGAKAGAKFGRAMYQKIWLWMAGTSVGSSLLGLFTPTGRLGKKLGPKVKGLGTRMGKIFGRGLVVGMIIALPWIITNFRDFSNDLGDALGEPFKEKMAQIVLEVAEVLNEIIQTLNDIIRAGNQLTPGKFGDMGEIGEIDTLQLQINAGQLGGDEITSGNEPGKYPPWFNDGQGAEAQLPQGGGGGGGGGGKKEKMAPGRVMPRRSTPGSGNIEVPVYIDGREVARAVHRAGTKKRARQ